jgi:hypothetical protein
MAVPQKRYLEPASKKGAYLILIIGFLDKEERNAADTTRAKLQLTARTNTSGDRYFTA